MTHPVSRCRVSNGSSITGNQLLVAEDTSVRGNPGLGTVVEGGEEVKGLAKVIE